MELLSGVQERLTDRLGPIRAWLFPRQVYLQLEDQAITAMALEGSRIVWLERVPLPPGLCENGEPVRIDSLGDLIGDLLAQRGFFGARVVAVLPAIASQMRLVQWPDGRWPEEPDRILGLNEAALGLRTVLPYLDLQLVDLPQAPPTSLVVTVPTATLERWIEIFSLAQVSLERMEAAQLCVCRGLLAVDGDPAGAALQAVLQLEPQECRLLVLENGLPAYERRLPGAEQQGALVEALGRWRQFWMVLRPGAPPVVRLALHGSALRDESQAEALAAACHASWQILDPLAQGWLTDASPDEGLKPDGPALAALWGLVATEVTA